MIILNEPLTQEKIVEILQDFSTNYRPKLEELERYYLGKHNILKRVMSDNSQPNNKIVINYPALICDSFASYLVGTPITYGTSDRIKQVLEYNDVADLDLELATDSNIFGYAIEQIYLDEEAQIRLARSNPKETILLCDNTIEHKLIAAIKYFPISDYTFQIEVYTADSKTIYQSGSGLSDLTYISQEENFFSDVPFIEYINNEYRKSSFDSVITLVDGLEKLSSDEVNTFEQFCDCYMILKNVTAEAEDIQKMKTNRVLLLDEDSEASYLTKQVNIEQINSLKQDFINNIHKISCVPNMSDVNFAANASGVAIRYKLLAFENATAKKERKFKKGLQRRIELINAILSITEKQYLETTITFTRNLPVNEVEIAQEINMLRGLVSTETLISQLPFIENPQLELERLAGENSQSLSLYDFGSGEE